MRLLLMQIRPQKDLLKTKPAVLKNAASAPSGIILFAKQPGKTSFSSLFTVKHALDTTKVGHTGTLDSFAQGLMVVLSGSMTRLVPYITAFDKTYEAVIEFGSETDTLDPTGSVIKTAPLPDAASLTNAISKFRGELDQKPPLYSAIHVDGKRASDVAVKGGTVDIPSRKITVCSSDILEFRSENGEVIPLAETAYVHLPVKYAHVRFHVSKGTYIRSLARDIADACGSAGHLAGLLRTSVGSFSLADAAGAGLLRPFSIESVLEENAELAHKELADTEKEARPKAVRTPDDTELTLRREVVSKMKGMSRNVARECGLTPVTLKKKYEDVYFNGRPLRHGMFDSVECFRHPDKQETSEKATDNCAAVFTEDGHFSGVISVHGNRVSYQYVVHRAKTAAMKVFSWEEILDAYKDNNNSIRSYFKDGSALTIGGFDGPHAGHMKLFDAVIEHAAYVEAETGRRLKKGVVTFRQPPHSVCTPENFQGDVSTLALKTDLFALKGFDFVIVIDFSSDFSRMKGNDFLSILKDCCSMQFAAAGVDFRCGHKLDTGVAELSAFARQNGFQFQVVDDVTYNGKRISSSLIRTCVQTGKMKEAEMLLGRPYTVDVRNIACEIRNELHCLLQIANGDVRQILPPVGVYTVKATSAGARTCNTVLHVDSSLLRLEIPPEWSDSGIEKIEFTTLVS